jgi:hypothetical protein
MNSSRMLLMGTRNRVFASAEIARRCCWRFVEEGDAVTK